jgi:hypothetical protein
LKARDKPIINALDITNRNGKVTRIIGVTVKEQDTGGYGDPADRRLKRLEATPEGVATLVHIQPWVQQVQDEFVAPMSEPERRKFEQLCRKLLGHHQE